MVLYTTTVFCFSFDLPIRAIFVNCGAEKGSTPLLSHLRVAIDTEIGTKASSEKARMLNTAFVSSLAGVKSGFLSQGLPTPSTCRKPAMGIPTMGLGNLASGAKILLVAGALTVGAVTVLPQASSAGLFNFSGEKPSNVGLRYERYLDSCPASPNCISSMANAVRNLACLRVRILARHAKLTSVTGTDIDIGVRYIATAV